MASMYGVYHGAEGLRAMARRVHGLTLVLARGLERLGLRVDPGVVFDTLRVRVEQDASKIHERARRCRVNLRAHADGSVGG